MPSRHDLGQNHSLPFTCEIGVNEGGLTIRLSPEFWIELVDRQSGISVFDLNVEAALAEISTALYFYQATTRLDPH